MTYLKNIIRLTAVITVISYLRPTLGSSFVISDERVRSLDAVPDLGRGYSIGTNSYQSICLLVDETVSPSYNYDCKILFSHLNFEYSI